MVSVWTAFSQVGKSKICYAPTIYNELLEDALIFFMVEKVDKDCILQQNNAAVHVSKQPPYNQDFDPMENFCET